MNKNLFALLGIWTLIGQLALGESRSFLPPNTYLILKQEIDFTSGYDSYFLASENNDRCEAFRPKGSNLKVHKGTLLKVLSTKVNSDTSTIEIARYRGGDGTGYNYDQDVSSYDYKHEWLDIEVETSQQNIIIKLRCEAAYRTSSHRTVTSWDSLFAEHRKDDRWNQFRPNYSYVTVIESYAPRTDNLEQFFDFVMPKPTPLN